MFVPNPAFIAQLADESGVVQELEKAAEASAKEAEKVRRHIMPSRPDPAVVVDVEGGKVTMTNTDHGGHLEEFGSANNPAYGSLRTGVRNAGYEFQETDR